MMGLSPGAADVDAALTPLQSAANRALRLRYHVWLARREIDRHRDVFMHNQPVTTDLAVPVSDPHNQIDRLALHVGSADMLDGVAVAEGAVGLDV
jgi:hypothetical protein